MIKKLNVVLFVLGLLVMGVMNLFLYNRADVSAAENRTLAKFPQFSTEALKSGDFFSGIEAFYADRFMFRDSWIGLNDKIMALKGVSGEDEAEIITLNTGDQFAADPDKAQAKANEPAETKETKEEKEAATTETEKATDTAAEAAPARAGLVSSIKDLNDRVKLYARRQIAAYLAKHPEETNPVADAAPATPNMETVIDDAQDNEAGEVKSNFLVLKDSAYEIFGYREAACQFYAESLNQFAAKMPETMRIFSLVAPSHIEFIQNKKYREMSGSQEEAIRVIDSYLSPRITPVDARSSLLPWLKSRLF